MTPDQIAKSGSEHAHQSALFAWCAVARINGFEIADAWANGMSIEAAKEAAFARPVEALRWFHAIHNQGHGDAVRGGKAKAEGVRKGIADTFLPWPVYVRDAQNEPHIQWAGLYIEMKKPSEKPKKETSIGGLSEEQRNFAEYAKSVGYGWIVCYSWREAAEALRSYIEWGKK